MNKRVQLILLSAFVVATICSYLVYRVVGSRLASAPEKANRVVVATTDVKLGSVLKASDLALTDLSGPLPKGAITSVQDAVGRGVVSDLYQGEPVLDSRLAAPGAGGGLAATIRPGMRACAIKVDDVVGVAGFVTPGEHVDVLISGTAPNAAANGASEGPKVKTLLQNIEVLSAGTDLQRDGEGKAKPVQVVNLLVTPEQAQDLSLASNQAKIQLVLRNPLDNAIATPPVTSTTNLFSDQNAAPAPAPKPAHTTASVAKTAAPAPQSKVYLVQVFNGSKRSDQKFVDGEEKQ